MEVFLLSSAITEADVELHEAHSDAHCNIIEMKLLTALYFGF